MPSGFCLVSIRVVNDRVDPTFAWVPAGRNRCYYDADPAYQSKPFEDGRDAWRASELPFLDTDSDPSRLCKARHELHVDLC